METIRPNESNDNFLSLERLGYNQQDYEYIISSRGHYGALISGRPELEVISERISNIRRHHSAFLRHGYTRPDIVSMASEDQWLLPDIASAQSDLDRLNFSRDNIMFVVNNNGLGQSIRAMVDNHSLMVSNGYTNTQISRIISDDCYGDRELQALAALTPELKEMGYTNEDITTMCTLGSAEHSAQTAIDYTRALSGLGFTQSEIIQAIGSRHSEESIPCIVERYTDLLQAGLNKSFILLMLLLNVDGGFLGVVADYKNEIVLSGTTPMQLVEMAADVMEGTQRVIDIGLSVSRYPAIRGARQRLDMVQNRLTTGQAMLAWRSLRLSEVHAVSRNIPRLAPVLANATRLFAWSLHQAGIKLPDREPLLRLAEEGMAAPIPLPPTVPVNSIWSTLRSRAVESAQAGSVIRPGWSERCRVPSVRQVQTSAAGAIRPASDEVDDRPPHRRRTDTER